MPCGNDNETPGESRGRCLQGQTAGSSLAQDGKVLRSQLSCARPTAPASGGVGLLVLGKQQWRDDFEGEVEDPPEAYG